MASAKKGLEKTTAKKVKGGTGAARQPKNSRLSVLTEEGDPAIFKHLPDLPKNFTMPIFSPEQASDENLERIGDGTPYIVRKLGGDTMKHLVGEDEFKKIQAACETHKAEFEKRCATSVLHVASVPILDAQISMPSTKEALMAHSPPLEEKHCLESLWVAVQEDPAIDAEA